MNTLTHSAAVPVTASSSAQSADRAAGSLWRQRAPITLAVLALAGWLLWSVSARQALLLLVGVGLGAVLAAARFGFTTG